MDIILKTCTRCKEVKSVAEFNGRGGRYPGPKPHCKDCDKKLFKEWSDKNAEHNRKRARDYHHENRDVAIAKMKERYWADPEKARARVRDQRLHNPNRGRAHATVQRAIKAGKMHPAHSVACASCGGPAEVYHHHKGYDREHWLTVVPLCALCHGKEHRIDK
jgi:hypothetical protein